jgi:hypothetical protein
VCAGGCIRALPLRSIDIDDDDDDDDDDTSRVAEMAGRTRTMATMMR